MEDFVEEMNGFLGEESHKPELEIPSFDVGFVVLDRSDNHVVENRIFGDFDSADGFRKRYSEELPSLVENDYVTVKVTRECLQYGAFPYADQMYFIYDVDTEEPEDEKDVPKWTVTVEREDGSQVGSEYTSNDIREVSETLKGYLNSMTAIYEIIGESVLGGVGRIRFSWRNNDEVVLRCHDTGVTE